MQWKGGLLAAFWVKTSRNAPEKEPTLGKGGPCFGNKYAFQTTRNVPETEPTPGNRGLCVGNERPAQTSQNIPIREPSNESLASVERLMPAWALEGSWVVFFICH